MDPSKGTERDGQTSYVQKNSPRRRGTVYANQGTGPQIINTVPRKHRSGMDTKALLVILAADVVYFFFGMLTYTGENTAGDTWRAVIFLALLLATAGIVRRWLRRRV